MGCANRESSFRKKWAGAVSVPLQRGTGSSCFHCRGFDTPHVIADAPRWEEISVMLLALGNEGNRTNHVYKMFQSNSKSVGDRKLVGKPGVDQAKVVFPTDLRS